MAQAPELGSYREPNGEPPRPFDEDESSNEYTAAQYPDDEYAKDEYAKAEYEAFSSPPSANEQAGYRHPDEMPLFLSEEEEEPEYHRFGSGGQRTLSRAGRWSRILKVGIVTASAAGIALAIMSMEDPLAIFGNAKASLAGVSLNQPNAAPNPAPEAVLAVRAPTPQLAPAAPVTVGTASTAPTRDEIALALRSAHQVQPEVRQPDVAAALPPVAAAVAAAPPARRMDPDQIAALLKRAKGLIAIGDLAPARLLLERAADAQEPSAALLLAQTYDPTVLGTQDMRSVTPDPAAARSWYQKAARLGSPEAQQRLAQMN